MTPDIIVTRGTVSDTSHFIATWHDGSLTRDKFIIFLKIKKLKKIKKSRN